MIFKLKAESAGCADSAESEVRRDFFLSQDSFDEILDMVEATIEVEEQQQAQNLLVGVMGHSNLGLLMGVVSFWC